VSLRPVPARWFELLTAREDLTRAVQALAQTASVELETRSDVTVRAVLPDLHGRMEEYNRLARRYEAFWPQSGLTPSGAPGDPVALLDAALQRLYAWEQEAAPLVGRLQTLETEQAELGLLREMLDALTEDRLDLSLAAGAGPVLACRVFAFPPETRIEHLPGTVLHKKITSRRHGFLLVVGGTEDLDTVVRALSAYQARSVALPPWLAGRRGEALEQIARRMNALAHEAQGLRDRIRALGGHHRLHQTLGDIRRLEWFMTHVGEVPVTENFAWVTGWTSDLSGARLRGALSRAGVQAVLSFPPSPRDLHPPMVMQNPWWARPFELFAKLLGMPARDEADPSRLLALLVPLLFGYMFGDVGHGLILTALGLIFARRWPVLRLLIANGCASMVFGVVFGSVFGREDVIPPLWVNPIEHPLPVLLVPLGGGVVVLVVGLALSGVEAYWRGEAGRWWRVEAAVMVIYLGLIAGLIHPYTLWVSVLGLGWYLLGSLREAGGRRLAALGMAMGRCLEGLLQLLINTVSFVRVGAFALAHAGLSLAITALAEAVELGLVSAIILLLGNLVVIMLEGLVVMVQTTRLILFEFFIRFLRGTGRMFHPLPAPTGQADNRKGT
jgi:V/A-type H+-transporting ATPase subunit I